MVTNNNQHFLNVIFICYAKMLTISQFVTTASTKKLNIFITSHIVSQKRVEFQKRKKKKMKRKYFVT